MNIKLSIAIISLITVLLSACKEDCNCPTDIVEAPIESPQGFHEHHFAEFPDSHAEPGGVYIIHLEHKNTPADSSHEHDSGEMGHDIIPYNYTETATHKFTIGDSSYFNVEMFNDSGEEVFELTPENSSIEIELSAGRYEMHLTSNLEYSESDSINQQIIFIQRNPGLSLNGSKKDATQYNQNDLDTYLHNLKLYSGDLSGADLSGKDLRLTICVNVNLQYAKFIKSNLSVCTFDGSDFTGANMTDAILNGTNLFEANMEGVNLINADLTQTFLYSTSFHFANLENANFKGAMLNNTDFKGAFFKNTTGPNGEKNWQGEY